MQSPLAAVFHSYTSGYLTDRGISQGGLMETEVTASRPELAELATLADALVSEIGEARGRYEELIELIDKAEVVDQPPEPEPRVPVEEIDDEAERAAALEDEAHLVALAMATNGAERHEARDHLVGVLGIDDPEEILDRAFSANPAADEPEERRKRRFFRRSH
jgi:hypothetical protein